MPTWKSLMIWINFHGQPYNASMDWRATLLTASKALVRSMNAEYKSRFCSMYFCWTFLTEIIISTMLCPEQNPHWASYRLASDRKMSQFRMTWARIFLAMERSQMPLKFPQLVLLPIFLYLASSFVPRCSWWYHGRHELLLSLQHCTTWLGFHLFLVLNQSSSGGWLSWFQWLMVDGKAQCNVLLMQ